MTVIYATNRRPCRYLACCNLLVTKYDLWNHPVDQATTTHQRRPADYSFFIASPSPQPYREVGLNCYCGTESQPRILCKKSTEGLFAGGVAACHLGQWGR